MNYKLYPLLTPVLKLHLSPNSRMVLKSMCKCNTLKDVINIPIETLDSVRQYGSAITDIADFLWNTYSVRWGEDRVED